MRFELKERVDVAQTEPVLRSLEFHLRTVAQNVVRAGDQLTASGIGPSPRSVNRNDTTVVQARVESGATLLAIEVSYQASALLGGISQDDVVRSKIVGVLREVRRELGLGEKVQPPPDRTTQTASHVRYAAAAERVYEQAHPAAAAAARRPAAERMVQRAEPIAEPLEPRVVPVVQSAVIVPEAVRPEPDPQLRAELKPEPELREESRPELKRGSEPTPKVEPEQKREPAAPIVAEAPLAVTRPLPEVVTRPIVEERPVLPEPAAMGPDVSDEVARSIVMVADERATPRTRPVEALVAPSPEMQGLLAPTAEAPSRIELTPEPAVSGAEVTAVPEHGTTASAEPMVVAAEPLTGMEIPADAEPEEDVVPAARPGRRRLRLRRARTATPLVAAAAIEPVEAETEVAAEVEHEAGAEADRQSNVRVPFEAWPMHRVDDEEGDEPGRSKTPWIVLLVLLAVLGGVYAWRGPEIVSHWIAPMIHRWREGMGMAPAASEVQAPPTGEEAAEVGPPPNLTAKPAQAVVTEWVRDWAEAQASGDAEAQASYYADPVDRYFLRSRVSHAAMLAEKETAIAARPPKFSFTIEDVVVERESATDARVRLVKHVESQTASKMTRIVRVHSLLVLKRMDGAWKIVQERDLL